MIPSSSRSCSAPPSRSPCSLRSRDCSGRRSCSAISPSSPTASAPPPSPASSSPGPPESRRRSRPSRSAAASQPLLERLGRRAGVAWDAATALLLVAALALGIVLASDVFATGAGVDRLLFGSLLAIGGGEILVSAAALLAAVVAAAAFRRDWIVAGFDELGHGSPRRRARLADAVLLVVVAMAAIAAIDAVGALLVSAILVVPAATARLFARSIAGLEAAATAIALAEGLAGLVIAYYLDAPPGAVDRRPRRRDLRGRARGPRDRYPRRRPPDG